RLPRLLLPRGLHGGGDGGGTVLQRRLRDLRGGPVSHRHVGQLLQASPRLRRHPLCLGHPVHPGTHPRRPRSLVLRDGFHLRLLGRDPAPHPATRECAALTGAPARRDQKAPPAAIGYAILRAIITPSRTGAIIEANRASSATSRLCSRMAS